MYMPFKIPESNLPDETKMDKYSDDEDNYSSGRDYEPFENNTNESEDNADNENQIKKPEFIANEIEVNRDDESQIQSTKITFHEGRDITLF